MSRKPPRDGAQRRSQLRPNHAPALPQCEPVAHRGAHSRLDPASVRLAHRLLSRSYMTNPSIYSFGSFAVVVLLNGCGTSDRDLSLEPTGPVARDAREAWPQKPTVSRVAPERAAQACAAWASCSVQTDGDREMYLFATAFCLDSLHWSLERAIPISRSGLIGAFDNYNERGEFFVDCAIASANDCGGVQACLTERAAGIVCQEDGCRATEDYSVACEGDVAVLTSATAAVTRRDCSRAFAKCDTSSPTGCTDRQFSACPTEAQVGDRCDGQIRLGCDRFSQVSYHDCARIDGGACVDVDGRGQCQYDESTPCTDAVCANGKLTICAFNQSVTIDVPTDCP